MKLHVYKCGNCGDYLFTNVPFEPKKRGEELCKHCGAPDSMIPVPEDKVKFEELGPMTIAWFYERCPRCGKMAWLPWLNGHIDYDFCPNCQNEEDMITRLKERRAERMHDDIVRKDVEETTRRNAEE